MEESTQQIRRSLFLRLSAIVFVAELAHGMLLYGIVPQVVNNRFPDGVAFGPNIGVSAIQLAGFCLLCYILAELVFKLPAGHIVDDRGPDIPLRVGLFVSLITVPIILRTHQPLLILLGAFAHGLGASPIWPAVISAWTRGRSAHERGKIMGQILMAWMAGLGLGVVLGNILVDILMRFLSRRGATYAMWAPFALWFIPLAAAFWGERLGVPAHECEEGGQRQKLRLDPKLCVMAIGLFAQNLAFGSLILPFRDMTASHLDLSPLGFGLLVLLGGAPSVLLLGPMGTVADRFGRRNAVIVSILVVAPLIAVAPFLSYLHVDPWVRFAIMLPGMLLAAVAYAFLLPAWHGLALGRIPEAQRGRSLALLMSIEMVALGGGNVLGPSIYSRIHFTAPFVFAGVTFALLGIIYWAGYILPPETGEEPHPVEISPVPVAGGPSAAKGRGPGDLAEAAERKRDVRQSPELSG